MLNINITLDEENEILDINIEGEDMGVLNR